MYMLYQLKTDASACNVLHC